MTRVWLFLLVAAALLAPTARAQDVLRLERLTNRTQFYSRPSGTVAFLPQVKVSGEASTFGGVESNMTDNSKPNALKPQSNADRLLKHLKADS